MTGISSTSKPGGELGDVLCSVDVVSLSLCLLLLSMLIPGLNISPHILGRGYVRGCRIPRSFLHYKVADMLLPSL